MFLFIAEPAQLFSVNNMEIMPKRKVLPFPPSRSPIPVVGQQSRDFPSSPTTPPTPTILTTPTRPKKPTPTIRRKRPLSEDFKIRLVKGFENTKSGEFEREVRKTEVIEGKKRELIAQFSVPGPISTSISASTADILETLKPLTFNAPDSAARMSFQNYMEQPPSSNGNSNSNNNNNNPRSAPPSPGQGLNNGMNGAMMNGMVGYPTPAGHQSDLNHIMATIEELSKLNAHNQLLSIGVVEKMGRIREKAKNLDMDNDGLLKLAATDLNDSTTNLERENKELRTQLDEALHDKRENFKLAVLGANILADITEKMHVFKSRSESDTLTWHRNYRAQLAYEREENLRLRNEINDKIAAAARANGHLRDMRAYMEEHDEMQELRCEVAKWRMSCRHYRRIALPLVGESDSEWSDDDDLVDPVEKKRVAREKVDKVKGEEGEGEGAA